MARQDDFSVGMRRDWTHSEGCGKTKHDRDLLGRIVRDAWVRWAANHPDPKPSWLTPYDELAELDKEADRQIGEALLNPLNVRRHELIDKQKTEGLNEYETLELDAVRELYLEMLEVVHPAPRMHEERLRELEERLRGKAAP